MGERLELARAILASALETNELVVIKPGAQAISNVAELSWISKIHPRAFRNAHATSIQLQAGEMRISPAQLEIVHKSKWLLPDRYYLAIKGKRSEVLAYIHKTQLPHVGAYLASARRNKKDIRLYLSYGYGKNLTFDNIANFQSYFQTVDRDLNVDDDVREEEVPEESTKVKRKKANPPLASEPSLEEKLKNPA